MEDTSQGVPQFATAEYAPNTPILTCAACNRPISAPYYQINGAAACAECTEKIQAQIPQDNHAAFVRALAFGIAGALVGLTLYVVFAVVTGLVIGWVSLAVGYIVGKAMSFGSRGVGGRRYQVVAVVLTYLAVSLSAAPIAIYQMRQQHQAHAQVAQTAPEPREHMSPARAIGTLALLGIASPFLELQDPMHGIIGLIILFVGIRFAWRFTARSTVAMSGPHTPMPAAVV